MIETFRTEIIEAEKSRTDLLKWKLIIVAALGGASGLGMVPGVSTCTSQAMSPILTLSLIPLVATYVDLLCKHLQLRIRVIGRFFQCLSSGNEEISYFISYEKFCVDMRKVKVFDFEDWAQTISTTLLSILIVLVAVLLLLKNELKCSTIEFWVLIISGVFGFVSSFLIRCSLERKIKMLELERADITLYEDMFRRLSA